ncbi:hypothetical protein P3384_23245 [Vibrio parahaemolyticus]|uniref:hypothetical protein n=1 Tax=Vibrio parahaemolyticus TaxID=670 RepID=UPI0009A94B19|nr:hypothetical protein [Vibrio parahaemolyticus]MDF4462202.1 hypothetical protein [Vibrio parahaemolyticus]MDF4466934.1 hypothetical protein [Vibrio parahaemolyticus]MDF4471661.1 hypothetical protein [Vibrio parahaemolyticus]MDF4494944.1 hypothetical protein [Vibrio parahaemolyticus]MDF4711326.1 hypothetical protein [Vibrio parahaemolyticus]
MPLTTSKANVNLSKVKLIKVYVLIPFIGAAVASAIAKVTDELSDASNEFSALSKDEKNQAIALLHEKGVAQKHIADSFGISAPAVSQRLKKISANSDVDHFKESNQILGNASRLVELSNAGFSNKAVTALLKESGLDVNEKDVDSFFKVCDAVNNKLNMD